MNILRMGTVHTRSYVTDCEMHNCNFLEYVASLIVCVKLCLFLKPNDLPINWFQLT